MTAQEMLDRFLVARKRYNDAVDKAGGPNTEDRDSVLSPTDQEFMRLLYDNEVFYKDMQSLVFSMASAGAMTLEVMTRLFSALALAYITYGMTIERGETSGAIPAVGEKKAEKERPSLGSIDELEAMFKLEDNRSKNPVPPDIASHLEACSKQEMAEATGAESGDVPSDWNA